MPLPTFVAAGTKAQAAGTLAVPHYAGVAANDVSLIVVWGYADVTFSSSVTGYTNLTQVNHASGMRTKGYWRRMDGSETGNISVTGATSNANMGVMFGFRNCIGSGTPLEGFDSNTGDVASNLITSPSTVTSGVNRMLVRVYGHELTTASSPPATWDERYDNFETVASFVTGAVDTKDAATAGTTSATTRNVGGGNGTSFACWGIALIGSLGGMPFRNRPLRIWRAR